MDKAKGDHAITRDDLYGTTPEPTYAGATSFMRRKYTRDLEGVDVVVTGIPLDTATTNRPGARFGPRAVRAASSIMAWEKPYGMEFDPFDKLAVRASTTPVHGCVQALGGSVVLLAYLTLRRDLAALPRVYRGRPLMTVAVLLVFAAIGLQFLAYRGAMVGEVETIKRVVGLVASLGAGLLVFGERITRSKVLGVAVMGAGVALNLLGAVG